MTKYNHKYLKEFKRLEKELRRISQLGDKSQFKDILDKAEEKNYAIKLKKGVVWDLYGLRNVFAHADRDKYIAEVNDLAYKEIDKIIESLQNPPTVGKVFRKKVFKADIEDLTENIIREMKEKIYTHVPVYDRNKFVGVFSETSLLYWLAENIKFGKASFQKLLIRDIKKSYLNTETSQVEFVSENTSIYEIKHKFDSAISKNRRLGAILITKNGKKDEKLIGIITAWDLPKIDKYIK